MTMTTENSNLHLPSNIYPIQVGNDGLADLFAEENRGFLSRIMNRPALRKLVQMKYGGLNDDGLIRKYLRGIPGISEMQTKLATMPTGCALAEPGERPWGLLLLNGEYREVCRCDRTNCSRYYAECRPEEATHARAK